jgi:glycerol-3-phosphate dehydrogenase
MDMRRLALIVGALTLVAAGCSKKDDAKMEPKTEPVAAAKTEPAAAPAAAPAAPAAAPADPAAAPPAAPAAAAAAPAAGGKKLFLDEHDLGKVSAKDVAEAHKKDLATEGKYGVEYLAYWVDEKNGKVYCLSEAPNADAAVATHKEAHGLIPQKIMEVNSDNGSWKPEPGMKLFMDVHHMGKGKVTPEAVAEAHKKDLAVQDKHKVKYLNYWVDADSGTIMCLSEAPNAAAAVATHKEAHGLVPDSIAEVSEGR